MRIRKVSSGSLLSIHTFWSILFQWLFKRTVKILIRLCGWAGWSAPSLAYARRHVFAWCGPRYTGNTEQYLGYRSTWFLFQKEVYGIPKWYNCVIKICMGTQHFLQCMSFFAQANQNHQPVDALNLWLPTDCPVKTRISLRGRAGWSESSLGTHAILYLEMLYPAHMYSEMCVVYIHKLAHSNILETIFILTYTSQYVLAN